MTMDARLAGEIKGIIAREGGTSGNVLNVILQACDEAEEAALHPSVGAWTMIDRQPIHLPSYYAGQRAEADDSLDRWLQINRDMVSRGFVQNWLRERARQRAAS